LVGIENLGPAVFGERFLDCLEPDGGTALTSVALLSLTPVSRPRRS